MSAEKKPVVAITIGDPAGLIDPSAPRVHVALTVDHDRFITDFTWRIAQLAGD